MTRPPIIASYGGGTNSTAMLIEWLRLGFPLDAITFADTGGEKPHTYEYVKLFDEYLREQGAPGITVVRYVNRHQIPVSLEQDCLRKATLPSKAFGYPGCSLKWKAEPQEKWVNNWAPAREAWGAGQRVVKLLGFDADEPERAERRVHADATDKKYAYMYPLLRWDWGRAECVECIERAGLPRPGKSSCFFCPSMTKPEIRTLVSENPDLAVRAVLMEREARNGPRGLDSCKGLGRRFSWEDFITGEVLAGATSSCDVSSGEPTDCGCYDG